MDWLNILGSVTRKNVLISDFILFFIKKGGNNEAPGFEASKLLFMYHMIGSCIEVVMYRGATLQTQQI